MSSAYITAREVMDRSAVLLNDPDKTDYNHVVLMPFLRMALDELSESLLESQSPPTVWGSPTVYVPVGVNAIYPPESVQVVTYPENLVEIQELKARPVGQSEFSPMKRREYMVGTGTPCGIFTEWSWEVQTIILHRAASTIPQEIQILGIYDLNVAPTSVDSIVGGTKSRSFLAYKTAAYAAMFIGENQTRAEALDNKASEAMERIDGINNKGRQQIMTRHRPFRAAFKARGGF